MDGCFTFSLLDSFSQEFAIRRFCQARISLEKEADNGGEMEIFDDQMELLSPRLCSTLEEELQFVDSLLNAEYYEIETDKPFEQHKEFFDQNHQQEVSDDRFYEDLPLSEMVAETETEVSCNVLDTGLHLVHSLLACAEAVGCRDTQLAKSLLDQIWHTVSNSGDPLQRVAYCFALGLKTRLSLLDNVKTKEIFKNSRDHSLTISTEARLEAFHFLHAATPFVAFGYMAANDAIFEAAKEKDFLHIIDLGMHHSLQWPNLIRNLASRTKGAPKSVRITGINEEQDVLTGLESSMKVVIDEAASLGVRVEFCIIAEPVTSFLLTKENLGLREGEVLFVNSIMNLHKFVKDSRGSLKMILQAIKRLTPALMTVVEQDANHNGPFFLGRFLESLHYYSAIFDSLEASLARESIERMKIEKFHFAQEIQNIVAYEGSDRFERHERVDQWRRQISRAGFQPEKLNALAQIRTMLQSAYAASHGYTIASEKGCLLLGWKGRSIMLATAWKVQ
ncbi:hypothetical protein Leryth_001847 [Lithospermum erythrorhizon]|nr:hypothetical protein Leryth_001847 [Lithospermum erythrorhizon]